MSATAIPCFHSISVASLETSSEAEAFASSAKARVAAAAQPAANRNHFLRLSFWFIDQNLLSQFAASAMAEGSSLFTDVFVPQRRIFRDKFREKLHTFVRRKINDFDSIFLKPVDAAAKIDRFADDHGCDSKLPDQSAAIPARRQRGHHNFVAIAALTPRFAKRIGLAVRRRIAILHPAVAPAAQQR